MKRNLTTWLSLLGLFITLVSCEDHRIPAEQRFRIKKVTKQGDNQSSTDTYSYDSQGRLDNIYKAYSQRSKGSNRDYYYTTVFQYNAEGKLSRILYQPDYKALGTIMAAQYDYTYDGSGNIATIKTADYSFNLFYDGNQFPVKISAMNSASEPLYTTEYIYDKGNVVKVKTDYFDNKGAVIDYLSYTRTYQFDAHPNPFYNLYVGAPDPNIFSDNAFQLSTFYQSNTFNKNNALYPDFTYEYDSSGNLIKITGYITITLDYEAY